MTKEVILRSRKNKKIMTFLQNTTLRLTSVAETGLSHRLTVYKIFGLSYLKILGNNQVENIFLQSVTFQFHARMRSSEVAQSLKRYGHFSDHGVSHCHDAFFRV